MAKRPMQDVVNSALSLYPETAVSDIKLMARIWQQEFGLDYDKVLVAMADAHPNTISRVRRKIQEEQKQEA